MESLRILLFACLLAGCNGVLACDGDQMPTQVVVTTHQAPKGVPLEELLAAPVCLNLAANNVPPPQSLEKQGGEFLARIHLRIGDSVRRFYWPGNPSFLAEFQGFERREVVQGKDMCSIAGTLNVFPAQRIALDISGLDTGARKNTYVQSVKFERYSPTERIFECDDKDLPSAIAGKALQFKISELAAGGQLIVRATGIGDVTLSYDQLKGVADARAQKLKLKRRNLANFALGDAYDNLPESNIAFGNGSIGVDWVK